MTHSLFGAALARTRLGRDTPLATPILVLSANLPDVDVASYAWGADAALSFRRGWTHGPLGLAVLPLLLAGLVFLWTRRRGSGVVSGREVLGLCYVGALSHPLLDWMNTYGVRVLMPFREDWFYGDALFIVDPWMWLLLGGAVFLVQRGRVWKQVPWAVVSVVALALLWASLESADRWLALLWIALLIVVVSVRRWASPARLREAPTIALAVFGVYCVGMIVSSRLARGLVEDELGSQSSIVDRVMVSPRPTTPFAKDIVALTSDGYRLGRFDWLASPRVRLSGDSIPAPFGQEPFETAFVDPCIAGFARWVRFPSAEVETSAGGWTVHLSDLRYVDPRGSQDRSRGFGTVTVRVEPP